MMKKHFFDFLDHENSRKSMSEGVGNNLFWVKFFESFDDRDREGALIRYSIVIVCMKSFYWCISSCNSGDLH